VLNGFCKPRRRAERARRPTRSAADQGSGRSLPTA
jgi:hypothetical protein